MTRTGAKTEMSVKCLAVVQVAAAHIGDSVLSHRRGTSANLVNQYQQDFAVTENFKEEQELLPLMLTNLQQVIREFITMLGNPLDTATNKRQTAILMSHIDLNSVVVVLGQSDLVPVIEDLGAHALHSRAFGPIPKDAAANYGDSVFSRLMWLKATSIYTAAAAGFDVLFTPFFVNSGFYYQKNNPKTAYLMERMLKSICEISSTHSHQATLTRHITEAHHAIGLQISVLPMELFPSGIMYHHNKPFVRQVLNYEVKPFVWHMCWTSSRDDKVKYFKEMGMWFIDDTSRECVDAAFMNAYLANNPVEPTHSGPKNSAIKKRCCMRGEYWRNYPK